ncbi:hypothetical protein [Thermoactinospora rubra]|uniref:hypothetical protein n=1 Tax=Thermoactinospora rubra TaxID=1088767 RepID=UPI00197FDCCE|nr:hypothetical protein [Thermoactinospora rubra]
MPYQLPPQPEGHSNTGVVVGTAFAGFALFLMLNFIVGLAAFTMGGEASSSAPVVAGAVLLALIGIGGGLVLLFLRRPWAKGLGLGLMIGWAFMSIVTAGFCTGLNPNLYS